MRRPGAGAPGRWYTVQGVASATPLSAGRLLLGQLLPQRPDVLSLSITDGRRIRALAQVNSIEQPVQDVRVHEGVVQLLVGDLFEPRPYVVHGDGTLSPQP